jgi:hypothetical protein
MSVITEEDRTAPPDNPVSADEPPDLDLEEAPYGWMRDPQTGEMRPKKKPGRQPSPSTPPDPADLPELDATADEPPKTRTRRERHQAGRVPAMPRGGIIAAGVNKLYRRAGKIIRGMDADIGQAVIECTRKDDPDDITVGEAWEALAKVNPRVRAFLLRAVAGGVWTDLVLAHAPIGMAILMKPAIAGRLLEGDGLLSRMAASYFEPDEDTEPGDLTVEDAEQMTDLIRENMDQVLAQLPPRMRHQAETTLRGNQGDGGPKRGPQPKRQSRSQRRGH